MFKGGRGKGSADDDDKGLNQFVYIKQQPKFIQQLKLKYCQDEQDQIKKKMKGFDNDIDNNNANQDYDIHNAVLVQQEGEEVDEKEILEQFKKKDQEQELKQKQSSKETKLLEQEKVKPVIVEDIDMSKFKPIFVKKRNDNNNQESQQVQHQHQNQDDQIDEQDKRLQSDSIDKEKEKKKTIKFKQADKTDQNATKQQQQVNEKNEINVKRKFKISDYENQLALEEQQKKKVKNNLLSFQEDDDNNY